MHPHDKHTSTALRQVGWLRMLLLVLGVVVIAGATLLVAHQMFQRPTGPAAQYSPPHPPIQLPTAYPATVTEQVARGLRLTVVQVRSDMRVDRDGLFGVAQAQGVSERQLSALVLDAFQTASDQMIASGLWTRQQADTNMRYWRQRSAKALIGDVSGWFDAVVSTSTSGYPLGDARAA
jgi:hypothetical protein